MRFGGDGRACPFEVNVETTPHPKKFTKRRALLVAGTSICLVIVAAFVFAKSILCVEHGSVNGEVIVVLGGDSVWRTERALELFKSGAATSVIVSGDGDGEQIRQSLLHGGVPESAVEWESQSRNTKENAEFTARLLQSRGVRRALIVTSWWHSRRALNSFSHFASEIRFSSQPTYHRQALAAETTHVFQEYLKTGWYFFYHGISPKWFSEV